jgi:phosphocarrier protein HPr
MKTRTVVVASSSGLHARPAAIFSSAAAGSGVTIAKGDGAPIDASSVLAVMSLDIGHGETVTLSSDCDDNGVLEDLAALLATDLDTM